MADQTLLQKLFNEKGFPDYRWIEPSEIVVGQWVRMKCMYGSTIVIRHTQRNYPVMPFFH